MKELVALVLVAAPGIVVYVGWRRGRFELAFGAAVVALLGVWGASALAIETDYRDADGYMDCWPSCTAYHHAVGVAFWLTIPVLVLLTAASGVVLGVSGLRRRAARPRG